MFFKKKKEVINKVTDGNKIVDNCVMRINNFNKSIEEAIKEELKHCFDVGKMIG